MGELQARVAAVHLGRQSRLLVIASDDGGQLGLEALLPLLVGALGRLPLLLLGGGLALLLGQDGVLADLGVHLGRTSG